MYKSNKSVDGTQRATGLILFTFNRFRPPPAVNPNPMRCRNRQLHRHTAKRCKDNADENSPPVVNSNYNILQDSSQTVPSTQALQSKKNEYHSRSQLSQQTYNRRQNINIHKTLLKTLNSHLQQQTHPYLQSNRTK